MRMMTERKKGTDILYLLTADITALCWKKGETYKKRIKTYKLIYQTSQRHIIFCLLNNEIREQMCYNKFMDKEVIGGG